MGRDSSLIEVGELSRSLARRDVTQSGVTEGGCLSLPLGGDPLPPLVEGTDRKSVV